MTIATTNGPSAADRLRNIGSLIRGTMSPVIDADAAKGTAKDALSEATDGATNAREQVMVDLAALAHTHGWTEADISSGVKLAIDMGNAKTEKAIATFMGETKRAMHPNVRPWVQGIIDLRNVAWNSEAEVLKLDKDAHAPIKKAFVRKYHLMTSMFGEAAEGRHLRTVEDVVSFAEARNPDLDPARQAKLIAGIVEQLNAIYGNFQDDDIKAAADGLLGVTKDTLKAVRASSTTVADNTAAVTVPAVEDNAGADATGVTEEPGAVPEGASDIIDNVLEGMGFQRAA